MKPIAATAVLVFVLVAAVHLVRLVSGTEITVGGFAIPVWWSTPACVVAGGLAYLLWREASA